jgi:hypothetical protein
MTGSATPDNENTLIERPLTFNNLRVFPEEPNWDATPGESMALKPFLDSLPNGPLPAARVARGQSGLLRSG